MKRKLVKYEDFEQLKNNQMSKSINELLEAEEHLAKVIGAKGVNLVSFNENNCLYQLQDGSFLNANYRVEKKKIVLEDVENLIIDEQSEEVERKSALREMLEAVLDNKSTQANQAMDKFMELASIRHRRERNLAESHKPKLKTKPKNYKLKTKKKNINEWKKLSRNVIGYLEHASHVFSESRILTHEDGTATITMPTHDRRNEGKVLTMQYDTIKTDVKILRENARRLVRDQRFCQMIADCRRYNGLSDDKQLEETLSTLVSRYPAVLYLTQSELSNIVAEALKSQGERSFGDEHCNFISEGILRTAHSAYTDRVNRIMRLTQSKGEEYEQFQSAVTNYYPQLDETVQLEFKMFEDLYNATAEIKKLAINSQNDTVRVEANSYLNELDAILSGRQPVNLDLAADIADWLETISETNLSGSDWEVQKTPYRTVSGDHPQMAKNARHGYAPSSDFSGDWGDAAPVSDGKSYKNGGADEMRHRSWGNWASKDTYPDVTNPYTPPSGEFTMPHEKGVDKDHDDLGTWQSNDTFPNITNPYIPHSGIPRQRVEPNNSVE